MHFKLINTVAFFACLHLTTATVPWEEEGDGEDLGEVTCTLQHVEALMASVVEGNSDGADEYSYLACENEDGVFPIDEASFDYGFFKNIEPSVTEVTMSQGVKRNGKYGKTLGLKLGASAMKQNNNPNNRNLRGKSAAARGRRQLAPTMGLASLIVLYAIPPDFQNDERTSEQLANDIFGISTTEPLDAVNARSQILACSRGQLEYIPACDSSQACFAAAPSVNLTNGVLEVPITDNVNGVASGTVVNWVTAAAKAILSPVGIDLDNDFTQVMVVAPDEASWGGAAAWAYLPGRLSAFRDSYSWRMGVQVHEFGHNIGLHHSGYNGAAYADHSCLMGSPSYGDDGPQICWNAAKSWETNWYVADSVTVVPTTTEFNASLIGAADWSNNAYTTGTHKVVLEIADSTESQKYYVMYNRAKGPNVGVSFAKDQVTVSMGAPRQVSWHQAGLGNSNPGTNSFERFRKPNYNGGSKDLVIKVCGMTTGVEGSTPDTAEVLVYLDDGPAYNNGPMCPDETPCVYGQPSQCDDGNWCTQNECNTDNTCIPPVDISATLCPTCGELTYCNKNGYCDAVCDDQKSCTTDSCQSDICQHTPLPGCGIPGAKYQIWNGIGGTDVSDLTGLASYPNSPDEVQTIEGLLKSPVDRADNFGARISTTIVPTTSGMYNFYVASDDSSELWLSSDSDPANMSKIAFVNGWTSPEQWDKYPTNQKSADISLTAGQEYYLEAIYKEGGGGDHISIAWESPLASPPVPFAVIGSGSESFWVETLKAVCTDNSQCDYLITDPCTEGMCNLATGLCDFTPIAGCENGALLERWFGISGNGISALTSDPRFPDSPDENETLSVSFEKGTAGDAYGSRLQSWIMPPVSCDWNFYIASDDNSELYLSSDADPANRELIANVGSYTGNKNWYSNPSQKGTRSLVGGQQYYLEALHKEGGGGDHLAIAWECSQHGIALEVLPAQYATTSYTESTSQPTASPITPSPSVSPTKSPSLSPSVSPVTEAPVTPLPSSSPSKAPTDFPTKAPTDEPSSSPSKAPTDQPTLLCQLGGIGDGCSVGTDCCSGACSGGKPSSRVCISNTPTTPAPSPSQQNSPEPTFGCTLSPKNGQCDLPEDCCSGNCKNNGRCA